MQTLIIAALAALLAFAADFASAEDVTRPETEAEAMELAAELGYGESCGSRCWNCKPGSCPSSGSCYCPFSECLENCAGGKGNHPVCCHGCCYGDNDAAALAASLGVPVDWQPPSVEIAEAVADYLGLGKSCGDRCWNCSVGGCGGKQPCPFFSCTINCSNGHHPVCCWGCDDEDGGKPCAAPDDGNSAGLKLEASDHLQSFHGLEYAISRTPGAAELEERLMAKTLTLRLSDADAELVEWAKDVTLQSTATKAVLEGLARYRKQAEREGTLLAQLRNRMDSHALKSDQLREQAGVLRRMALMMDSDVRSWNWEANDQQNIKLEEQA